MSNRSLRSVVRLKNKDGNSVTIFCKQIIFYESVKKELSFNEQKQTWEKIGEGTTKIYLTNNEVIEACVSKEKLDRMILTDYT